MKVLTVRHHSHCVYVNHDSRYWIREAAVVSLSSEKLKGVCQQHRLILQCDCCTVTQTLQMPECTLSESKCINCVSLKAPQRKALSARSRSSKFTLSSDKLKMGMVLDHELHVLRFGKNSTQTQGDGSNVSSQQLVSSTRLSNQSSEANAIELVALGHLYAIIAYIFDSYLTDYKLCIVSVSTGDVLTECRRVAMFYDWATPCHVADPLHKFYFMFGEDGGEWLSDIRWGIPDSPLTTLHNHHGRIHLEAVMWSGER